MVSTWSERLMTLSKSGMDSVFMAELYKVTIYLWDMGHIVRLPGCLRREKICDDMLGTVDLFIGRKNKLANTRP